MESPLRSAKTIFDSLKVLKAALIAGFKQLQARGAFLCENVHSGDPPKTHRATSPIGVLKRVAKFLAIYTCGRT